MELSITSVLALFVLLALSSGVFYVAKRFHLPYTVLLVAVGLLLVPIAQHPWAAPAFGFIDDLQLTPELLFYIFLPVLIFESGYAMSIRTAIDNAWTIISLAIVGLLISAFGIAAILYAALQLAGIDIPFVILLLFGSIISATDPVAVLALFKDFGAPKRLSIIFEGESLFNDGTAVALFLVVLATLETGFDGVSTVALGALTFLVMVVTGLLLGLFAAAAFTVALRGTRANEFVSTTLLIISAHLTFITGELINEQGWAIASVDLRVSSIIATTMSSLYLGNYARHTLTPRTDAYVDKSVSHLAFIVNSLVFLLAGLLFASLNQPLGQLWLPMVLSVIVVAGMRAISIYAVTGPINALSLGAGIPRTWQMLLAWGSLRGALAIIVVVGIPETLIVPGWPLDTPPREFLIALTISCILVTLFVKAPLIGPIMRRLHIDDPEPVELARRADLAIYYLLAEQSGFEHSETQAVLRRGGMREVVGELTTGLAEAQAERDALVARYGEEIFTRSLWLTALMIEDNALKQLYVNGEVSERIYRRLRGKLILQGEHIVGDHTSQLDEHRSRDGRDIFDRLTEMVIVALTPARRELNLTEEIESARAQLIMSRRVVRVLTGLQTEYSQPVFHSGAFDEIVSMYAAYDQTTTGLLDDLAQRSIGEGRDELSRLARVSRDGWGMRAVASLRARGVADEGDEEWLARRFEATPH